MISRECYNTLGPLDEIFSPGYGEDTDYCHKAEDAGFQVVQVPQESKIYYGDKRMTGNFPIWHEGNVTFKNWPGGEDLLAKNNKILEDRYKYADVHPEDKSYWKAIDSIIAKGGWDNSNKEDIQPKDTSIDISIAEQCDGYMSTTELEWLAKTVKNLK